MSDNIFSLAKYLAAKKESQSLLPEPEEGDLFLLEEGFDLLASYRSIADRDIRLRIKGLVDLVGERPDALALLMPGPTTLTVVDTQPEPIPPAAPRQRQALLQKSKAAAAFIAMLAAASFILEIVDPASTDVVAGLVSCTAPTPVP